MFVGTLKVAFDLDDLGIDRVVEISDTPILDRATDRSP
jgi:hypothetical protein